MFTGRLDDNKEKGLDVSKSRSAIDQQDLEKLFKKYFIPGIKSSNTKVLLQQVFFDILYYMGHRGKKGFRNLNKTSFEIKTGVDGIDYIQLIFNEKTKKNQGDQSSSQKLALHNDQNIISTQPNNILCPVESFKTYVSLLNDECDAFFQYNSKDIRTFDNKPIGKNSLATMMKDISEDAQLSCTYTNHCIRKTTATALHHQGFDLSEIQNVTKHKNIDSLKHYISVPTYKEKKNYNNALLNYAENEHPEEEPMIVAKKAKRDNVKTKKNKITTKKQQIAQPEMQAETPIMPNNENIEPENWLVPMFNDETDNNVMQMSTMQ